MRNVFAMAVAVTSVWWVAAGGQRAEALDLVKDGKPRAVVVLADNATQYQKWGAGWLVEYVEKATGARLQIVPESQAPADAPLISVGHTAMAKKSGLATDDLKYDGCKLVVKGNVLFLIGRDYVPAPGEKEDSAPEPASGRPQGTIRAVTKFLQDVVGVRWFIPGPEGTIIPKARDLVVPDTLNKTFVPFLSYCDTGYDTPVAQYANNSRSAVRFRLLGGDDTWEFCVPHAKYYAEHPEYFRMDESGQRAVPDGQSMLCTSNREVWKIMLKGLQEVFDQGYDAVELGQSDGWQPCLCPECQKEFGDGRIPFGPDNPCERVWTMHKWLFDELAKSHPDKKVMVTIYGPGTYPSKRFASLPDNVIAEFCSCGPEDKMWQGKFKTATVLDYYVWDEGGGRSRTAFLPVVSPGWAQARMRVWREHGVMGAYGGGRGECWGLGGPTYYIYARLAENPDANADKLLEEYCRGIYGESASTMERFFRLFHSRTDKALDAAGIGISYENGYQPEDAFTSLYPPSVVNQLDLLLRKAEKTATDERARGWLRCTRDSFDGLKAFSDMFTAKRFFEMQPTRESLQAVKDRVETFEQWRSKILSYSIKEPEYLRRWFPRYESFCLGLIGVGDQYDVYYYGGNKLTARIAAIAKGEISARGAPIGHGPALIQAPVTWDFDKKFAALGKAREDRQAFVQKTLLRPGPDGALDPAAWAAAKEVKFEKYQAADSADDPATATSVRLLYDDQRLYVQFECHERALDNLKLKSVGRDGGVYYLDEVELFLNPECSARKFMHFMASPTKDSWYDERKGYIEDPLDPRYNEADVSWNADWTYTYKLDHEKKLWTLEMAIPFKSLNVAPPREGTVWTANFARVRRAEGGEDLSCWIAEEFGNPEVFGEMAFGGVAK